MGLDTDSSNERVQDKCMETSKVHLDHQENKNLRQHVTELEAMNKARRVVHFGQDYKPRSLVQTWFMDFVL
jgi:hypothetical protein